MSSTPTGTTGTAAAPKYTNRLVHETSPYLRQHAHNPVDWYPWGPEALERAKREDKPILLSIGYAACHWCHVMEHESFESEPIAELMNEHFVCVKVDREERPDLDAIYQRVIQLSGRSGGWPLTVFLTPSQKPFFVGTYFPAEDRYGMPAFPKLLNALADAYQNRRDEIELGTADVDSALARIDRQALGDPRIPPSQTALAGAVRALARRFDPEEGGLGRAPKFPSPQVLELLLREWHRTGDDEILAPLRLTLSKMAQGGIYDHLGGGFHRYSTDRYWLVPHFEKMLYDNAQLAPLYADAHQALRALGAGAEPRWLEVVHETLTYIGREMTHPEGGFLATQDADSEGEEGKFFVWHPEEVEAVLGDERAARLFMRVYDVTPAGNFEGASILHPVVEVAQAARELGLAEDEAQRLLADAKARLFQAREKRVKPGLDDKVITSWNGLMIGAAARTGLRLGEPRYVEMARRAADFVLSRLVVEGRPLRVFCRGEAKLPGYLDDHALLAAGLVDLWQALGALGRRAAESRRYLEAAQALCDRCLEHFADEAEGGFFLTADDAESLIHRPKSIFDEAIPAGTAVLVATLQRLHALTGAPRYADVAERTLGLYHHGATDNPFGMAGMLLALADHLAGIRTAVLVGTPGDPAREQLLEPLARRYHPALVLVAVDPTEAAGELPAALAELVTGKLKPGAPAVYLCHRMACSAPIRDPAELARTLEPTRG